jgi:hypothetical protein
LLTDNTRGQESVGAAGVVLGEVTQRDLVKGIYLKGNLKKEEQKPEK